MVLHESFLEKDLPCFEPDSKVGLLGTVNEDGSPHLTLITAMRAPDTGHLVFGQFCEGRGKTNAENRKKTGFLIMGLDKVLWRGKAEWTGKSSTGPEHEHFNNKPMWRYNSYFGIHTVHFMKLHGTTRAQKLPLAAIAGGIVKAALVKRKSAAESTAMNDWTKRFISKAGNLKFLSYIDENGYPAIIPCFSATAPDGGSVYIPGTEYKDEIRRIPDGCTVCLFTMSMEMEDVVVRGRYRKTGGGGIISIEWVYNSMPPLSKQIYPPEPAVIKVTAF